jgi:hypothetical protein
VIIVVVVAVFVVLVLGLLVVSLLRRGQQVVPEVADRGRDQGDEVVATDEQGRPVLASQEPAVAARDDDAFEGVLHDELKHLAR